MELYLIRHGECEPSIATWYDETRKTMNPPLTEEGVRQAAGMALRLKETHFDAIYCSDLLRTVQTTEALHQVSNAPIYKESAFREIDMGEVFLHPWSEFPEIYEEWSKHEKDVPYPGGENGQMVWERCKPRIQEILSQQYERVAIVCHAGTIRSILAAVLGLPQQCRFYLGCPIENCSVSILRYQDGKFFVHSINS